jgi:ribose 5-phosphate isomerase B
MVSTYGIPADRQGDHDGTSAMRQAVVALASDHAGYELKELLKKDLEALSWTIVDLGCKDAAPVDYPDMGYALAQALRAGRAQRGVLVCGSGIGISIAANRFPEIRAALVHDALGARLARSHNDANVICFGGRMIGAEVARDCLRVFLDTDFEGGRHAPRVDKLSRPN